MPFTRVNPGDLILAQNLNQVIGSLNGTASQGVPIAQTSVNDASNYALSVQNLEATNSRAINVVKSDGSLLIRGDATGVSLGSPLNLPTGSITSTAIADGTIQNADLGPDVARANLLTNGGMEIWQRGNGPFTGGAGTYSADRWAMNLNGTDTVSISKNTANVDIGSQACAAITFTFGTGAGASKLGQILRTSDNCQLNGRPITASVRVNTSTATAVRLGIDSDGTGGTRTYSSYHPGSGGYQTLTVTITVPTDAAYVWLQIFFGASCTAYLDNACLVVGSQPANYVPLHPADDLARCLRYYRNIWNGQPFGGYTAAAGFIRSSIAFQVPFAVTPTLTSSGVTYTNASALTIDTTGPYNTRVFAQATALGDAAVQYTLVGEANP
ncbi:MAG TPA: hypothetical protein VFB50_00330 [Chloroflexota bacterium]|nr:hypothetical protein [Chloroflexota bacterium]